MEPTRETEAGLVDLLDRVLEKGLIIHADVVITLAGVPLIGINLKAALANMETMLDYGMFESCTKQEFVTIEKEQKQKEVSVEQEKILVPT
ncbi:gas vesicle protein [Candidatus Woesearchaeota archaeon]|nr:gas vesicle protein [Candidatus Woesearchaeota archaeon]